jgi:hypothetical protein
MKEETGLDIQGVLGKCDVRIRVIVPSTDPKLASWRKWGRKYCDPKCFDVLNRSGSGWKTWYIYFGVIEPSRFTAVDILNPEAPTKIELLNQIHTSSA